MEEDIYNDLKENIEQAYSALRRDLARVRTGRASATLLDTVRIDYYGQPTLISQVAAIQVPEARMLTIKPWEANLLREIERAIINSDLGLAPNNDGALIRLQIPPLTEERRRDLVKQVQKIGETAKVSVRNHRRSANELLKASQKDGEMSEDDLKRALKQVQGITDTSVTEIDRILAAKSAELQEV